MNKSKKKAIILGIICLVILIGAFTLDRILSKSYLKEIKYSEVMEKVENKESFILLLSQTTCTHCMDFKPKLKKVANKYEITVYYLETDLLSKEENATLKEHFSFRGTPQTLFVVDGEEKTAATRIDGDVSEEKIISKFKSNGYIE
jgi:predicted bacteriocin transport accessory protein